jgi:cobalt-zinc-cadmium efflux system protein
VTSFIEEHSEFCKEKIMSHIRKPLIAAAVLNTGIFFGEAVAGYQSQSLSLLMDSVHNLSDELALVCLALAFVLPLALSRTLQRSANVLNSVGLVAVSGLLIWESVSRLFTPVPVVGLVPVVVGLLAAIGNGAVAWYLQKVSEQNAAIRLAYLHNLGDVYVSLAPVVAGVLVTVSGGSFFDAAIALLTAVWVIWTTVQEVVSARDALLWPADAVCPHHALASEHV